jgi:serine/threonine protein kinase
VGGQAVKDCAQIFPQQEVQVGDVHLRLRRPRMEEAGDTLTPQALALMQFLPREMRGERKYRVKGIIAAGGMGVVLEAEDVATRRAVAMKTLREVSSADDTARFIEEAQITAQLEHPNIVPIYEVNVNELDRPFYTMKLVRGESLKQVLQRLEFDGTCAVDQYPLSELLVIFLKVCDGIAYAHSKGVVHRDLKPENIMLGEFGETMIMDWGLAKPVGHRVDEAGADARPRTLVTSARRGDANFNTLEGAALGTPEFMSPEQASGSSHTVDGRADVYGLGAILYNILTLQPPVTGKDHAEILERVVKGQVTPPEEAVLGKKMPHLPLSKLPPELVKTTMKAMSLAVKNRHATVRDLQAEVRSYLAPGGLPGWSGVMRYFGGRKAAEPAREVVKR